MAKPKAKAPKAQKMVANDDGQPKGAVVARVNMHLPTDQQLVAGESIVLSKQSKAHLEKHFEGSMHHIIDDGSEHEDEDENVEGEEQVEDAAE